MATVWIKRDNGNGWDISVYDSGQLVKRAWGMNRDQAIGKGMIFQEYYTDDNGQQAAMVINEE